MHSDHAAACTHTGIARNSVGDVSVCAECNIVHLTLSHMTLRLTPEAFRSLSDLMIVSQHRLDKAQLKAAAEPAPIAQDSGKAQEQAPFPMINTPQRLH